MTDREREYWTPAPLWKGETVFVLASGPSLDRDTAARLHGWRVIVVNSTCRLAPWAELLYFTDGAWYEPRRALVAAWPGLVVSPCRTAKRELPDKVRRVKGEYMPAFPPVGSDVIRFGRSSGQTAISLAVALGAARIILLGFDCRVVDGREHHHDEYAREGRDLAIYANEFAPAFKGWHAEAGAAGVEIVNATPGSAITEFPMVALDVVLAESKAA